MGSLAAVQGVTVTAELAGKIVNIAFKPGTLACAGELLVQQDTSSEEAQLRATEAAVALAKLNSNGWANSLAERTISQSQYDNADAQFKQAVAQSDNIRATIAKKTIRAPFAGRLGIRLVNLGQMLNEGEAIVSLQSLDPIFVDFLLPQQQLAQVKTGLPVRVTTDALAGRGRFDGKITAINPQVDAATRNIRIQATVANRRGAPPARHVRQRGRGAARPASRCSPSRPRPCFTPLTATRFSSSRTTTATKSGKPVQSRAPAVCATRGETRRFRRRRLRAQGGRDGREHRRVQAAQRPVRGRSTTASSPEFRTDAHSRQKLGRRHPLNDP